MFECRKVSPTAAKATLFELFAFQPPRDPISFSDTARLYCGLKGPEYGIPQAWWFIGRKSYAKLIEMVRPRPDLTIDLNRLTFKSEEAKFAKLVFCTFNTGYHEHFWFYSKLAHFCPQRGTWRLSEPAHPRELWETVGLYLSETATIAKEIPVMPPDSDEDFLS